ncbi:hypothetical protein F6X40_35280 [Paraburkholderia sp. UCT31]|uniref:hypothetical protein n=1 Tax=Paraburkholderia sp. UCT31 TaxID=2615209 RepID=UPI001655ABF6|nr:hypothetical protein [Paraburkholderia sp. UCT31]MBC8741813.1 hypothetical protein [Paraburkholderia sp. UCT31]
MTHLAAGLQPDGRPFEDGIEGFPENLKRAFSEGAAAIKFKEAFMQFVDEHNGSVKADKVQAVAVKTAFAALARSATDSAAAPAAASAAPAQGAQPAAAQAAERPTQAAAPAAAAARPVASPAANAAQAGQGAAASTRAATSTSRVDGVAVKTPPGTTTFGGQGTKWTPEEDAELVRAYRDEKLPLHVIAQRHNRSPVAIGMRLVEPHKLMAKEEVDALRARTRASYTPPAEAAAPVAAPVAEPDDDVGLSAAQLATLSQAEEPIYS